MMVTLVVSAAALVMMAWEACRPGRSWPRLGGWWLRAWALTSVQVLAVFVAGAVWEPWMRAHRAWSAEGLGPAGGALAGYLVITFVYYWWHRARHRSPLLWRWLHQVHHSAERIEVLTSFYKHPVEITLNSLLSATLVYPLLGCDPAAGALYTLLTALAEYFYHWNVRTPRWLGYLVQRPESHRVHHQYRHHTQNFADLPLWDWMFGTFRNPRESPQRCGFDDWREDRFEDLLAFRDVHAKGAGERPPLTFLPTCIGCSKRRACAQSAGSAPGDGAA
jgi:sterol desaturase/sphingolipid hydroxylase (fatty acid hydroxylase superfamily)